MMWTVLADETLPHVPPWFFLTAAIRVLWIDLIEEWMYLEIEPTCPRCGMKSIYKYVLSIKETNILKNLYCSSCGYHVGEIVHRELLSYLLEIENLLKRVEAEKQLKKTSS